MSVIKPVDDDIVDLVDDSDVDAQAAERGQYWPVLVVDDDEQVHQSTRYALADVTVLGRRFAFNHAYSAREAHEMLLSRQDFAVILLDVVMETDDAGLRLVRTIRDELDLSVVRIVLRTGQPGYAPELSVIQAYDINDYRTKSELTHARLVTTMTAAIRSFMQLQTIEQSRRGLEKIVDAAANLISRHSLNRFAEGVLTQIGSLLADPIDGIMLARLVQDRFAPSAAARAPQPVVLAATGRHAALAGRPLDVVPNRRVAALIAQCLEQRRSMFDGPMMVLYASSPSGDDMAIHLETHQAVGPVERQLLEVFMANIAVGFDNAGLFERTERLAFYDPLTGLPNRTNFSQQVAARLAASAPTERRAAVLLVSIDNFEDVNDGLGYEAGDNLLRLFAAELAAAAAGFGAVARISGSLFAILADVADRADLAQLGLSVQGRFAVPLAMGDARVSVAVSVGCCLAEPGQVAAIEIIRHAGMALQRARRTRAGVVCFAGDMAQALNERLSIVNRLGDAIKAGQFQVYYQPQIALPAAGAAPGARRIVGVEALVRWVQADGTIMPPAAFIEAAEDSGHIAALGEWVLRQACSDHRRWRQSGLPPLRMAVNLSMRQLREPDFLMVMRQIMADPTIDPTMFEFELTETVASEELDLVALLEALVALGPRLSIDDFGVGYSSLSRLRRLPVHRLKIDRSFVSGIGERADCRSIAAMIVSMGHELGLSVIAEGVETWEQEAPLAAMGCDEAQGYLYARPLPIDAIERLLRAGATPEG